MHKPYTIKTDLFLFLIFVILLQFIVPSCSNQLPDKQIVQAWISRYDGTASYLDNGLALAIDGSGNVYVTGYSMGIGTAADYATIKYDVDGKQLWVSRYDGPISSSDAAQDIALDKSGNVYVTGYSSGPSTGTNTAYDYATIKYIP